MTDLTRLLAPGTPGLLPNPARATFRDPAAQASIEQLGWAVVPFLPPDLHADVRACIQLGPPPDDPREGFFPGCNSLSPDWKRAILEVVRPIIAERIAEVFDEHHPYFVTVLNKWPGSEGDFTPHQDPTMVLDGERYRGVTAWCPLYDVFDPVGADRGAFRAVPGSHRLVTGDLSGVNVYDPEEFAPVAAAVYGRHGVLVTAAPGEAVVFDHRLVHYTYPNRSTEPRLVLGVALRPCETRNVHVEWVGEEVEVYGVNDSYYFTDRWYETVRDRYELLQRTPRLPVPPLSDADVERAVSAVGRPVIGAEPPAPVAPDPQPKAGLASAARALARTVRLTSRPDRLDKPEFDRRLERDGFVRLPGRPLAAVAERALATLADDPVDLALDVLAAVAPSHRLILAGLEYVAPGDERRVPARPWTFTRERLGHRSLVVLVACTDLVGDGARPTVVRASHLAGAPLRGPRLGSGIVADRGRFGPRSIAVPLRAGEVLVLDGATARGRAAHHTADAGALLVVHAQRAGDPLVHYRGVNERVAARYALEGPLSPDDVAALEYAPPGDPEGLEHVNEAGRFVMADVVLDCSPLAVLDQLRNARRRRAG